jgi:hypothetical protein
MGLKQLAAVYGSGSAALPTVTNFLTFKLTKLSKFF